MQKWLMDTEHSKKHSVGTSHFIIFHAGLKLKLPSLVQPSQESTEQ